MPFEVSDERGTTRVRIRGRWTVAEAAQHQRTGHALGGREIAFDASGLEAIDLSGALQLWRAEQDVVMAGGHARWTPSRPELLEFLDGRVAKWWLPDDVVFIDEVPKTSVGKFSKKDLRERFKDHTLPTA